MDKERDAILIAPLGVSTKRNFSDALHLAKFPSAKPKPVESIRPHQPGPHPPGREGLGRHAAMDTSSTHQQVDRQSGGGGSRVVPEAREKPNGGRPRACVESERSQINEKTRPNQIRAGSRCFLSLDGPAYHMYSAPKLKP